MTIVSPSILSADFTKLGADCRMVLDAGAQMLHYDVPGRPEISAKAVSFPSRFSSSFVSAAPLTVR